MLLSQRNELLDLVIAYELDPRAFVWVGSNYLRHVPTGFYFSADVDGGGTWHLDYEPGPDRPSVSTIEMSLAEFYADWLP